MWCSCKKNSYLHDTTTNSCINTSAEIFVTETKAGCIPFSRLKLTGRHCTCNYKLKLSIHERRMHSRKQMNWDTKI